MVAVFAQVCKFSVREAQGTHQCETEAAIQTTAGEAATRETCSVCDSVPGTGVTWGSMWENTKEVEVECRVAGEEVTLHILCISSKQVNSETSWTELGHTRIHLFPLQLRLSHFFQFSSS